MEQMKMNGLRPRRGVQPDRERDQTETQITLPHGSCHLRCSLWIVDPLRLPSVAAIVAIKLLRPTPGSKNVRRRIMPKKTSNRDTKGQRKIHKVMKEKKEGILRSGSGQKVTSRKQAVAIALSEARKAGAKIPKKKS